MIEERLGRRWADWALRGITATMIISPLLFVVALIALTAALLLTVWGWALNEMSGVLGAVLAWAVFSAVGGYLAFSLVEKLLLRPRIAEEHDHIHAHLDELSEAHRQLDG